MTKKSFPLSKVYGLLEPGPVVLLTTEQKGRSNVMALAWHTMIDFEPPIIGIIVSNRNYSFEALRKTRECVINIPSKKIVDKVIACGNSSGEKLNKFKEFKLTALSARKVKSPVIKECFANIECKVIDSHLANKYNFFILEAIKAWTDLGWEKEKTIHHCGGEWFMFSGNRIKIPTNKKK